MLDAGDIVFADFDPVVGTEQGGRRPAILLTSASFHAEDQRAIACPITRNLTPWPTKVFLPQGSRVSGAILCDQVRSLHREGRGFRFIERAPDDVLAQVRAIIGSLLGIAS